MHFLGLVTLLLLPLLSTASVQLSDLENQSPSSSAPPRFPARLADATLDPHNQTVASYAHVASCGSDGTNVFETDNPRSLPTHDRTSRIDPDRLLQAMACSQPRRSDRWICRALKRDAELHRQWEQAAEEQWLAVQDRCRMIGLLFIKLAVVCSLSLLILMVYDFVVARWRLLRNNRHPEETVLEKGEIFL